MRKILEALSLVVLIILIAIYEFRAGQESILKKQILVLKHKDLNLILRK